MVAGTQSLAVRAATQRGLQCDFAEEHFVRRGCARLPVGDAERRARVALRIKIDHQGLESLHGKRGGKVDRGRCLAHAALLVGDGEQPAVRWPLQWFVDGVQHPHGALRSGADRGVVFVRCFT